MVAQLATVTETRIKVMYDEQPDLSYIEQSEADMLASGATIPKLRFVSLRRESRAWDGCTFKLATRRIEHEHAGGQTTYSNMYLRVGDYFVVELRTWHGVTVRRLALRSEVIMTWDDFKDTYGDLDNYISFGAVVQEHCPYCDGWRDTDNAVWGIDYYTGPGSTELWPDAGTFTLDELRDEAGGAGILDALDIA